MLRRAVSAGAEWLPVVGLWVVVGLAVCVPLAGAMVRVVVGMADVGGRAAGIEAASLSGAGWVRLALTVGVAMLVAVLAMALGVGPAWMAARGRAAWAGVLVAPLFLPTYLAYAGWGIARAPGTWVAGWLEELAAAGVTDAPVWAGRVLAVVGLGLWSWPLAMMAAWPAFSRMDQEVLDQTRLSAAGWRAARVRARLMGPGLLAGVGVVWLVMIGSAVPLHLAQIETDAIRLWRLLDQTSADMRWTAWVGAWPTVVIAVGAGVWIARRVAPPAGVVARRGAAWGAAWRAGTRGGDGRRTWMGAVWAMAVWGLSVLGPLALFAWSIELEGSLGRFWSLHGRGVADSATVAACVACVGVFMGGATAYGLAGGAAGRGWLARLTRGAVGPVLVAAILPGVLVGSATLDTWSGWGASIGSGWVADSALIVVLTHVARFGAVAALAGVWAARNEGWELSALRTLDGATGVVGWMRTVPPASWVVMGGAGLAMGLLSLHEIESAVIVHPVGMEVLSRHLLGLLHFSRDEELSAAAVWMIGLGLVPAALAGFMVVRGLAAGRGRVQPDGIGSEGGVGIEPRPRGRR